MCKFTYLPLSLCPLFYTQWCGVGVGDWDTEMSSMSQSFWLFFFSADISFWISHAFIIGNQDNEKYFCFTRIRGTYCTVLLYMIFYFREWHVVIFWNEINGPVETGPIFSLKFFQNLRRIFINFAFGHNNENFQTVTPTTKLFNFLPCPHNQNHMAGPE